MYFLLLFVVLYIYRVNSFLTGPQFHMSIPQPKFSEVAREREFAANFTHLEKQQGLLKSSVKNLSSVVQKTLTKIGDEESRTSKEVSSLKSQLVTASAEMNQLRSLLQNISTEVTMLKSANSVKGKQETKTNTKGNCPASKGYRKVSDSLCISLSDKASGLNWYDSRDVCKKDGGDLVTFYSTSEQEEAMKYLNDMGTEAHDNLYGILRVWVGMKKYGHKFSWISDSPFSGKWGKNQPMNNTLLKCVALVYDGLSDNMCEGKRRYVCQIKMET